MYTYDRSQIFLKRFANEAVLLDLRNGNYYRLNRTGGFLWKLLEEGSCQTQELMAARICEAFEIESADAVRDTAEFMADLERLGLIQKA